MNKTMQRIVTLGGKIVSIRPMVGESPPPKSKGKSGR
jgi:CpcD/allophycocyanin linker domain